MKISTVIITFNEEDRLEDALLSCRKVADELVVLDSHSTDRTVEIARKYGARVFFKVFQDYGSQKNAAMKHASHEWILNLDADERLSPQLRENLLALKESTAEEISGFQINRRTRYLDRWIRHSGWYPDRKVRLFRRDRSRWVGRIHERLEVDGPLQRLHGDILHHTYRDIEDHVARINRYTGMLAEDIVSKNTRLLHLRALILPPITFARFYLWKAGALDGLPGLLIALISSWGTALKYFKAIALKREQNKRIPDS